MANLENPSPRELAGRIGRFGVWCPQLQWQPAARARRAVGEIEALGYGAVWIGEATGKEIVSHAALLLGGGERIVIATGIASIWARDPMAMANAGRTLSEAYPGRFVLGLGVSHPFLTEPRDRRYDRPLTRMWAYLDAMDEAPYSGPPADPAPRVLAALGPRMLQLAGDRTHGAHPYFVPPSHTSTARDLLGPDPVLAPEHAVVLERDPATARRLAHRYTSTYLELENYASNLRRLGWQPEDLSGHGSDDLIDELVAWGDADTVVSRLRRHVEAGADHVAIRMLGEDPRELPLRELEELAGSLGS
jgi:probable F420-dependent oxidoreductase